MSTREEIEAAIETVTVFRTETRDVPIGDVRGAFIVLSDAYLADRQQRERDQQPPTREMFAPLENRHISLEWFGGEPCPVLALDPDDEVKIDTIAKLRAACLLLGINTEGVI